MKKEKETMMKTKYLWMLVLTTLFVFGLQSCDKEDDWDIAATPELQAAFAAKFPNVNAFLVRWEWNNRQGVYEADFYEDRYEKSAWFSRSYDWLRTETDFNRFFDEVPQVVLEAAQAARQGYIIEDVIGVETAVDYYYRVEMERGDRDVFVEVNPDGTVRWMAVDE